MSGRSPSRLRRRSRALAARSRTRSPSATTGTFSTVARGLGAGDARRARVADDPTIRRSSGRRDRDVQEATWSSRRATTYAPLLAVRRVHATGDDLDLCVFLGATPVGSSGAGDVGRGGQPRQPGGRRVHGRRAGLGHRRPGCAVHRCSTGCSANAAAGNMTVAAGRPRRDDRQHGSFTADVQRARARPRSTSARSRTPVRHQPLEPDDRAGRHAVSDRSSREHEGPAKPAPRRSL